MGQGQGSITYNGPNPPNGLSASGANDGLSVSGAGVVQLGGPLASPSAAKLLDNRSIPFDVFSLLLDNIGKAVAAHLKFKKDAGADALIEPIIEIFSSAGAVLSKLRVTDNNSVYLTRVQSAATGRNNLCLCNDAGASLTTGQDNVLLGAGAGFFLTNQNTWVAIGEDNCDMFPGSTCGSFGIIIGGNNFNAGFVTSIGNNFICLGQNNNNSTGGSIGDFVILIGGVLMGLAGGMHDTIIIGNQASTGPNITISNVVILGTGFQNILLGQSPVGAVYNDTGERVQIKGTVKALNTSQNIRAGITTDTFAATDCTLLMNSAGGAMTVSINPANLSSLGAAGVNQQRGGIIGNVKKISADANTITLNATSGQIFPKTGAPAASLVFSTQGQNVQFQSDGTNIYEL
jgi:hypothetical protein